MTPSIHGHDVIRMMVESRASYTRDSLRDAIHNQFGPEARFHTCSAENLTPDQLIDFLAERGKFAHSGDTFAINVGGTCGEASHDA